MLSWTCRSLLNCRGDHLLGSLKTHSGLRHHNNAVFSNIDSATDEKMKKKRYKKFCGRKEFMEARAESRTCFCF